MPLAATAVIGNFQAGYFRLPAALQQGLPIAAFVLRVNALDVERQAADFLAYSDAKRAGLVRVQRQVLALQVGALLDGLRANDACGPGQLFLEQHHRAQDDAQRFKEGSDKTFSCPILKGETGSPERRLTPASRPQSHSPSPARHASSTRSP